MFWKCWSLLHCPRNKPCCDWTCCPISWCCRRCWLISRHLDWCCRWKLNFKLWGCCLAWKQGGLCCRFRRNLPAWVRRDPTVELVFQGSKAACLHSKLVATTRYLCWVTGLCWSMACMRDLGYELGWSRTGSYQNKSHPRIIPCLGPNLCSLYKENLTLA